MTRNKLLSYDCKINFRTKRKENALVKYDTPKKKNVFFYQWENKKNIYPIIRMCDNC